MRTIEAFLLGALGLIALYLVVRSTETKGVIESIATGLSKVFGTLQGRT